MSWSPLQARRHVMVRLAPVFLVLFISGCSTLGFYYQSARGQLDMMCRSEDIETLIARDDTDPGLREKLEKVTTMRRFASEVLELPDNDSYKSYANLERGYAIWNVFAAPALSIRPHKWCFPIVGCVVYRGYFKEADAAAYAESLREQDLETYVAGVPAYSTLGWFDDPMLNTVMHYPEPELAGLIFHELAHQVAYASGDSIFNESFATAVEIEGVERWLQHQGRPREIEAYRLKRQRNTAVVETILAHRERLEEVYQSDRDRSWKLARKAEIIEALKRRYRDMIASWDGYQGYGRWFQEELNNAHFVVIAAYHDRVPAFRSLLARHDGDLASFYQAVQDLAEQSKSRRDEFLDALGTSDQQLTMDGGDR